MRGRTKWTVASAATVMLLVIGAAAVRRYEEHVTRQPDWQIHQTAVPDAAKKVDAVLAQFVRDYLYKAADYVHEAGQHPGVQVLSVTGQTHWQTGVTLVLKVTGHGVARGYDGVVLRQADVPICFRLRMGPQKDSRDDDIACPSAAPLPVASDPTLNGVDDRLAKALKTVGPDEAAVRSAVAGLKLDPAVGQEFAVQGGVVGVALRAGQYDCIIARVPARGAVKLWRPSHVQLAPGELGCAAGLAFSTEFDTSPH